MLDELLKILVPAIIGVLSAYLVNQLPQIRSFQGSNFLLIALVIELAILGGIGAWLSGEASKTSNARELLEKIGLVLIGAFLVNIVQLIFGIRFTRQSTKARTPKLGTNSKTVTVTSSADDSSSPYIKREPYEERWYQEILQPGALIRIKAPLQMGKTSLKNKILDYAKEHNYRLAALNLRNAAPAELSDLDKFLQWFCISVTKQMRLDEEKLKQLWSQRMGNSKVKCRTYFEDYIILPGKNPLALALDDADKLFSYPGVAGEFLGMLRTWHEDAKTQELWRQLRLVVLHTEVYTQIDIHQSPFNAGTEIKLTDLNQDQVQNLSKLYKLNWDTTNVKLLMDMVGGHPYLVSKAYQKVVQGHFTLDQVLKTASTEDGIYRDHLRQHLKKLQNAPQMFQEFKKVVRANKALELNSKLNSDIAVRLDDLGLVQLQDNKAKPRYELYRQYFRKFF